MKKLLLAALLIGASVSAFAQGTLVFANVDANGSTSLRLTNAAGGGFPPANSTSYKAGIYWAAGTGAAEGSLTLLPSSVTSTWTGFSGVFNGGTVTFPVAGGSQITFQVRVWEASAASYEEAIGTVSLGEVAGKGGVWTVTLGNAPGVPVNTPAANYFDATGVARFGILPVVVPEPSSIALGLLGLGAVAMMRRRK